MDMVLIKGRSTPAARFVIKGIKICEMLNKHLKWKIENQKQIQKSVDEIYEIELISDEEKDDFKNIVS